MGTGPTNGWGGPRPNSGRKPSLFSQVQQKKLKAAFNKAAREHDGVNAYDVMFELIYDKNKSARDRIAALKLFTDAALAKESNQNVNVIKREAPTVGLPPKKADPAKLVALPDKKAKGND